MTSGIFFKPQDSKKEFELRKTIESTLQLFEERMKLYGIRVDVMNDEHVMYYGYSNHLSQVLLNLINNSIDAHREQSEEQPSAAADRKIEIGYHLVKGFIEITLTDNAGGIDESVIENIFDPYFTTKDMQNGTGLGLYMSKTIIENILVERLVLRISMTGHVLPFGCSMERRKKHERKSVIESESSLRGR